MNDTTSTRPLFACYLGLIGSVPHRILGALPTPVERLQALEEVLGATGAQLYVKRDDLSGSPYGGNKVRKLEFILARAVARGYREVLTFGGAGSNHALATGLYARRMGVKSISMLIPQPNAYSVRKNLLLSQRAGIELHLGSGMAGIALATLNLVCARRLRNGRFPYLIAPGGTSAVGMVGFVNAAFELKEQIERGEVPEPDVLYAASGTMGTVIGLLLGLKAAGLKTKVAAVRVTEARFSSPGKAARLFRATNKLLHEADPAFPVLPFPHQDFQFIHDFYGEAYGLYTPEAMEAVRLAAKTSPLRLEGTYTGKTFAALLADTRAGRLQNKTVLFWNTHNSMDLSGEISGMDYHELPEAFHRYFEEDVQPLDRQS